MKQRTLKCALVCIICAVIALSSGLLFGKSSISRVYAESEPVFAGYYLFSENKATLEYSSDIEGAIVSVSFKGSSLSIDRDKVSISDGNKVKLDSIAGLALGGSYVLEIVTTKNTYSMGFKCVTKTISSVEDCEVLNIKTNSTKISGYYVLTNDIDLGNSWVDAHPGMFENGDGYITTCGFNGTFDGEGHNITFMAGRGGFFGNLLSGAEIMNLAFVNITYSQITTGTYKYQSMPILARRCSIPSGGSAKISNVYIHSSLDEIPGGAVLRHGHTSERLITENIIIKSGNTNSFSYTEGTAKGTFIAWEYGSWYLDRDAVTTAVYIISGFQLGVYTDNNYRPGGGGKYSNRDLYADKLNGWVWTYAANEGIKEDLVKGQKVYQNIKKYVSYNDMVEDEANDYSGFDTRYWDVTTYGAPIWKRALEADIFIQTKAVSGPDYANLRVGDSNKGTAKISLGMNGIALEGGVWSYEFLTEYDGYEFVTDAVTISEDMVVTAVKKADSCVKFTCVYQGQTFTKTVRFYVYQKYVQPDPEPEPDPNPGEEDSGGNAGGASGGGGCGGSASVNGTDVALGGGAVFFGGIAFLVAHEIKRRRLNK